MSYYYSLREQSIPFIMTVDTTIVAETGNDTFKMPILYNPNVRIDWGDGNMDFVTASGTSPIHQYSTGGVYQIRIHGSLDYFAFQAIAADNAKLVTIDQWGSNKWTQGPLFQHCINMQGAWTDSIDLSIATSISTMFTRCTLFNYPISFASSTVAQAVDFLSECSNYDSDINVDMPSLTTLRNFLWKCSSFNSSITFTDTSNVADMSGMFRDNTVFNKSVLSITTESLTDANSMFYKCTAFNQQLNHFDMSKVIDMGSMMYLADAFNQDITGWNTSSVEDMSFLFSTALSFNQDVSGWNISSLLTANGIFSGSTGSFSVANYDALLIGWEAQPHNNNVTLSVSQNYTAGSNAEAAKNRLINDDGWTITDSGGI